MIKYIHATLSIIPSLIVAIITWVFSLFYLLYKIPYERYYCIMTGQTPKRQTPRAIYISPKEMDKILEERKNGKQENDRNSK